MNIKSILSLGVAFCAFAANAQVTDSSVISEANGSEVLVSVQKAAGNQRVVAFDVVSDGQIAGFDFEVQIPGLVESSVNQKACVADLPKGFNGACRVNKGSIVVTAIGNGASDFLPNGMVSIGRIAYSVDGNIAKGAAGSVSITSMYLSDGAGQKKTSSSKVLEQ